MTTARRVFLYIVSLVGLVLLSTGGGLLLNLLFDLLIKGAGIPSSNLNNQQFSLSLAMLIIGGCLWFPFWNSIRKRVAASAEEIGVGFRKLYLNAIQTVMALTALSAGIDCLNWLFAGPLASRFPSARLATLIVAALVWYYHWRVSETEGQPSQVSRTLRRWYIYILSAWGLITLSFNLVSLFSEPISLLVRWHPVIYGTGSIWQAVYSSMSSAIVGAPAWGFFWFRMSRDDGGSTLRQVYFYLLAISGGAVAGLAALTTTAYRLIDFILGARQSPAYFQFLSWTVPAMLVAAAVWFYHQRLALEEAENSAEEHLSARRVHLYLMSFISLGAMVSGVVALLGVLLDLIINALGGNIIAGVPDWWRGQLSISLALLAVGVPIWLYYWGKVLRMVSRDAAERRARSRRVFLYVVLALAIIALAGGLVALIYLVVNALLQGTSTGFLKNIKYGLQSVLVALPLILYFWQSVREDQRSGAEAPPVQKAITLIASGDARLLAERLSGTLGYKVKMLRYTGPDSQSPELDDEKLNRLTEQLERASGSKVILAIIDNRITILPYQE